MAGKVTCACGKQYSWKPELAGKRAKCKCGAVVSFPATDPAASAAPEGFDAFGLAGDDAPPPPPPPPVGGDVPPPPPTTAYGNLPRGKIASGATGKKAGFNWKAALNLLIGLGIAAFGIYMFNDIAATEKAGKTVNIGRGRRGWVLQWIYNVAGKWGVVALFVLVGLMFIGGAIMVMMGKSTGESSHEE